MTSISRNTLIIFGTVFCVVLAAGLLYYLALPHSVERQGVTDTGATPSSGIPAGSGTPYVNPTYHYSVVYPAAYEVRAYTPEYVSIGASQNGSFASLLDIAVMQQDGAASSGTTFKDFVHAAAQLACAANGPTATIRCPSVTRSQDFKTASGLTGEKFYLNQAVSTGGKTLTVERGPFFAFNLSGAAQGYSALLLCPPSQILKSQGSMAAAQNIVDSLQIKPAQTRN